MWYRKRKYKTLCQGVSSIVSNKTLFKKFGKRTPKKIESSLIQDKNEPSLAFLRDKKLKKPCREWLGSKPKSEVRSYFRVALLCVSYLVWQSSFNKQKLFINQLFCFCVITLTSLSNTSLISSVSPLLLNIVEWLPININTSLQQSSVNSYSILYYIRLYKIIYFVHLKSEQLLQGCCGQ